MLGGALPHRLGGRRTAGSRHQCRIEARTADQGLRRAVRGFDQPELALQARQRQHAVLTAGRWRTPRRQTVDLVSAVGDEVEDEAHLASSSGNCFISSSRHAGGVPVERWREVVGQHLVRELGVDRVGELLASARSAVLVSIQSMSAKGAAARDFAMAYSDAALDLVVALGSLRQLAVPSHVDAHSAAFSRAAYSDARLANLSHSSGVMSQRLALAHPERDAPRPRPRHRSSAGLVLPCVHELLPILSSLLEARVADVLMALPPGCDGSEIRPTICSSQCVGAAYSLGASRRAGGR